MVRLVIVARDFAADVAERAGKVQASPGVELSDVLAIELLPRGGRRGNRSVGLSKFGCGMVARALFPGLRIDQGIDTSGIEVDADKVPGLEFGQPPSCDRFGRGVEDRGACGGPALSTVAQGGKLPDPLSDPSIRGEHVDDFTAAGESQGSATSDDQQGIGIAGVLDLIDFLVVVFWSIEDDRASDEGVWILGFRKVLCSERGADDAGFDQGSIEEVAA